MINTGRIVVGIPIRLRSNIVSTLLKYLKKILYSRDNFLQGAVTSCSSIAFSTLYSKVERLKQVVKVL
jgi:hypothetical protein